MHAGLGRPRKRSKAGSEDLKENVCIKSLHPFKSLTVPQG
jgi:hypothetical protein